MRIAIALPVLLILACDDKVDDTAVPTLERSTAKSTGH